MAPSDRWQGRRVLVTGATGIVGSWLVKELLAAEAVVVALVPEVDPLSELYRSGDMERVTVVDGLLQDISSLEPAFSQHDVQTVVHLAAQATVEAAHDSPLDTFETNIRGTYNLLELCRRYSETVDSVVVASSDKAYGEQPNLPYVEDMRLNGRQPYEVSKSCADLIAQSYHHAYRLPVAIARFGNIYGGGDVNWSRIVPGTVRSLLREERPVIRSDGLYARDYTYVKDAARAYMRLAEAVSEDSVRGEAFNFGSEKPITVIELVGHIQRIMECSHLTPKILGTATGEIHSQYVSVAKAREALEWRPAYDLEEGLRETVQWYRDHLAA